MSVAIRVAVLACLGVAGCYNGLDLSGHSMEGYESLGRSGGTMQTPDGEVEVHVERGALDSDVELTAGRLDDCFPGAFACYEIEPAGLELRGVVTVTVDISDVLDGAVIDGAEPLVIYVREDGAWRAVASSSTSVDSVSIPLTTLGPVALGPESPTGPTERI